MFAPLTAKKRKQPITKVEKEESSSSSSSEEEEVQMEPESVELSDDEEEEEEEEEEVEEEVEDEEDSSEEEEEEEEEVEKQGGGDDEEEEEEEDESSKRDTVRKLLEPFGKDQLLEFLKEAALTDRSIIERISKAAESDPTHRKIFVHGLGWDSTSETVISVFKQYGQIEDCKVVMDKATGKCKGYGFVLFKTRDGANKALKQPQKKIGNRTASCQLASHGPVPMNNNNNQVVDPTGRKIYVANVGQHLSPEKLRAFFAQFGEIEEGPLGYDRMTGKLKGFAIFVYKTAEGCKKALEESIKIFEGCKLQCSKALEGQRGGNKNVETSSSSVSSTGSAAAAAAGVLQHNNNNNNNAIALNYAMGLNPGMVGQNLNPAIMMGHQHHQGYGVYNPATWGTLNHTGLPPSVASGVSPSVGRNATGPSLGMGAGVGAQSGINSISPSVIGSYGSQAALQGLGAYQNHQLGQSSSAPAATRPQAGMGSMGTFPSYYGR